jgi:hypothetical protein
VVADSGHHPLSLPVPQAHLLQLRHVAQSRPVHGCPPRRSNCTYYRGIGAASAPPPAGPSSLAVRPLDLLNSSVHCY